MIVVDELAPRDDGVRVGLDRPALATTYDGHLLRLSGWVAGAERPVTGLRLYDGATPRELPLDRSRPDVRASVPGAAEMCGFDVALLTAGWPSPFALDLVATTDAGTATVATLTGRRSLLPEDRSAGPDPVLVTSIGRTGTSWLMHLLAEHPLISADPTWPHETSATRYWTQTMRRVAESPHGLDAPGRPDFPEAGSWWQSARAPELPGMHAWLSDGAVQLLADTARAGIRGMHSGLAAARGRPEPRWLAEKALPSTTTRLVRELFPRGRELLLVRDFRDMLASMNAFDAQRGYAGFGRDTAASEEAYVARLGQLAGALHAVVEERPDALVVRYEQLVADPVAELARVLRHLDLDPIEAAAVVERAERRTREMDDHVTSADASASVGRWRRDLMPELQELAQRELGPALTGFGYA